MRIARHLKIVAVGVNLLHFGGSVAAVDCSLIDNRAPRFLRKNRLFPG
jgi:hypothetical protein